MFSGGKKKGCIGNKLVKTEVYLEPCEKSILKLFFFFLVKLFKYLLNESPLKMMKNAFYFMLKALFVLEIFKFLS